MGWNSLDGAWLQVAVSGAGLILEAGVPNIIGLVSKIFNKNTG
jgi:hypothetical protein